MDTLNQLIQMLADSYSDTGFLIVKDADFFTLHTSFRYGDQNLKYLERRIGFHESEIAAMTRHSTHFVSFLFPIQSKNRIQTFRIIIGPVFDVEDESFTGFMIIGYDVSEDVECAINSQMKLLSEMEKDIVRLHAASLQNYEVRNILNLRRQNFNTILNRIIEKFGSETNYRRLVKLIQDYLPDR